MNAATAIRQQVRILAMEIGVREAARKLGLNEDTVCSWAKRDQWNITNIKPNGPPSIASNMQATTVGNAISDELADNEKETRLSLSRYARRAAKDAEQATLKDAPYVHKAAQIGEIAFKWSNTDKPTHFTLNMLNLSMFDQESSGEQEAKADTLDT